MEFNQTTDEIESELDTTFQNLKKVDGKKLLWAAKDNDAGCVYLIFEGMIGLCVTDAKLLGNGAEFCERFLKEHLEAAQDVVRLQSILTADKLKDTPLIDAVTAPTAAPVDELAATEAPTHE
jgi:hypothetical protein